MKIKVFQKGFNYSQDGEGNRLVYHLQGCNMCCPWCANPEGIANDGTVIEHAKGSSFSYTAYTVEELVKESQRSRLLFFDGGGVTLSGGEVTLQFEGVNTFLDQLKKVGIHTAIETNGSHPRLEQLFPFIDQLMMDFKHYDNEVHQQVLGIGNRIIKENIKKAMAAHPKVLIRIPVIKGFNDSEEDINGFISFFKPYDTRHTQFEFLPYHEYGKAKWEQCGRVYEMKDAYVDTATINLYETLFKKNNLFVIHT
ncbi:MAG: pflC [Clostridia bacterium]|nr:pflC [Clostridia bacterium]